jgi:hypothetical protein
MDVAEWPEVMRAHREFRQRWQEKHPGTEPPALSPERPGDPAWREAEALWDAALDDLRQSLAQSSDFGAAVTAPTWTAAPGYIGCPDNHSFPMSATFCPTCGKGPVPQWVRLQAEDGAIRMGERAGLGLLQIGGIR